MKLDKKLPPRLVISPRAADPFLNMIHKNNKSPTLKPVYVKPKYKPMKMCRSQESLPNRYSLPPLSPTYHPVHNYFDFTHSDRLNIRTPNFKVSVKKRNNMHLINATEGQVNNISFGDTEENPGKINEIISKYR